MELKKLKRIGIIILVLFLLLFVFANLEKAQISFFPGLEVDMPLALVIFLSALVGFVIGVFVALNVGREKKSNPVPQPPKPAPSEPPPQPPEPGEPS